MICTGLFCRVAILGHIIGIQGIQELSVACPGCLCHLQRPAIVIAFIIDQLRSKFSFKGGRRSASPRKLETIVFCVLLTSDQCLHGAAQSADGLSDL